MASTVFKTGAEVEVSSDEDGSRGAWYEARVARFMPRRRRYTVEYEALVDGGKPSSHLRETVPTARVRPRPPKGRTGGCGGRLFELHQAVDARRNDGWWVGVVSRVAVEEKGRRRRYGVCFPATREELEFGPAELRAHLEWANGEWILPESQGTAETVYNSGAQVEVAHLQENSPVAWFAAIVVKTIWRNNALVEYEGLRNDDNKLLREIVDCHHLRPSRPHASEVRSFELLDDVEAFYNDGWWSGVISKVHSGSRYSVTSKNWEGEMEFSHTKLRLHLDWVDGQWVLASQKMLEIKFKPGTAVEVSSDEEGFHGAWFTATVIKSIGKETFLVEYQNLKTDDETKPLTETVDSLHIRPTPPDTPVFDKFKLLEEVDAFYNDGWWVGVISKVLKGQRYMVYFRPWEEEMEFAHKDLRLHHDWIDGRWLRASQALDL